MVSGLIFTDDAICGGSMNLKIVVRDSSEQWNFLESKPMMIFSVTLICWEYMDTSLLKMVHTRHQENVSWGLYLTGSNEALRIHPSV